MKPVIWVMIFLSLIVIFNHPVEKKKIRYVHIYGNIYGVKIDRTEEEALTVIQILHDIRIGINTVLNHIGNKQWSEKFEKCIMEETAEGKDEENVAYTKNKKNLAICIDPLNDKNTLMYVALHELIHVIITGEGHTNEFWHTFDYVIKEAIHLKVYVNHNYHKNPVKFCGITISNSPLQS
jgi:hypothetical protein